LGPKGQPSGEFTGLSLGLIYPRLITEEVCNPEMLMEVHREVPMKASSLVKEPKEQKPSKTENF
jgi:hypothetical protein